MTSLRKIHVLFAAFFALFASALSIAQTGSEGAVPTFKLKIVGTRFFSDVDVIYKNLKKMPAMKKLSPTISSRLHLEFEGVYGGDTGTLVEDIQGLASDRFDVVSRNDKRNGLVITLKKISDSKVQ